MYRTATTKDVAAALGVTQNTVQLYSRESRIPFDLTPGGHRRYDVDEVRAALGVDAPASLLTPMRTPGLGAGTSAPRSQMAAMDAERRAIVGETLDDEVDSRRPLTGPQQKRFSTWVGRRFNRPTHSDQHETHVLRKAGAKISKLAEAYATTSKPKSAPLEVRLVAAAREWLIGGTDRGIEINVVVDAASLEEVGLYSTATHEIDEGQVNAAARKLQKVLVGTLREGSGYSIRVVPVTLDGISAVHYLSLEPWLWADRVDPLDDPSGP